MAEQEPKTRRKPRSQKSETQPQPEAETNPSSSQPEEPKQSYVFATGLEDYGRYKAMFKDHKREKNEKPFRRGRIWA